MARFIRQEASRPRGLAWVVALYALAPWIVERIS